MCTLKKIIAHKWSGKHYVMKSQPMYMSPLNSLFTSGGTPQFTVVKYLHTDVKVFFWLTQ